MRCRININFTLSKILEQLTVEKNSNLIERNYPGTQYFYLNPGLLRYARNDNLRHCERSEAIQ